MARAIFNLPHKDYYSVEYGNVYVAVVNCNANLDEAAQWLIADAEKTSCKWKVLTVHQPPYFTNPLGSSNAYNEKLPAAVDAAGIDLVFSGHDHAYARTEPLYAGEVDTEQGAVYFICGDLGEKSRESSYKVVDDPSFHFAMTSQSYQALYLMVNATDTTLEVTARDLDGSIIDSYKKIVEKPVCQHEAVYDGTKVVCGQCGEALSAYTGFAVDKETGKTMYFLAGVYKTGWFTIGSALYHFGTDGLAHTLTVVEDIPTSCSQRGHKTVKCECGKTYTAEYAKPAGHDYLPHTDEHGNPCYKCSFCGQISTVNVPFLDVSDTAWYARDVEFAYQNGYIKGVSALYFAPDTMITREQVMVILWRIAGEPGYQNNSTSYFEDVAPNTFSTAAINWGYENGIVQGSGSGKFHPQNNVTREEMVSIIYRYAKVMGCDMTVSDSVKLDGFRDYQTVKDYAKTPVLWAIGNGIIQGYPHSDGTAAIEPVRHTPRCQFAAVVSRLMPLLETADE